MIAFLVLAAAAVQPNDAVSLQSQRDAAACIAAEAPREARAVLDMDFRSEAYLPRLRQIANDHQRCIVPLASVLNMPTRFQSSSMLFAGSLAEAMLKPYESAGGLAGRLAFDSSRETIAARSETEQMALCTVLYGSKETVAVLGTKPGTAQEAAAMELLAPVLGNCLKQGMRVQLNRPAVRAMLALAAYRIVTTPKKVL